MANKRRNHNAGFKAKVALEALKEQKTLSELASQYEVHSSQINTWKKQLLQAAESVFVEKRGPKTSQPDPTVTLYEEIGRLKMQLDWVKKKMGPLS